MNLLLATFMCMLAVVPGKHYSVLLW